MWLLHAILLLLDPPEAVAVTFVILGEELVVVLYTP